MPNKMKFNICDSVFVIRINKTGTIENFRKGTGSNEDSYQVKISTVNSDKYEWFTESELKPTEDNKVSENKAEQLDNVEKILGIRIGEQFQICGTINDSWIYDGETIRDNYGNKIYIDNVFALINHPELIEKLPQKIVVPKAVWALLKAWQGMGVKQIQPSINGNAIIGIDENDEDIGRMDIDITCIGYHTGEIEKKCELADILDSDRYVEGK